MAKVSGYLLLLSMIFATTSAFSQQPVRVIFDTDMGPDYDDAGAITLLHAFADSGRARILATIASTKYEGVAAVLNVFNTYFGKPAIPIGVPKGDAVDRKDEQHWTDTLIAKYPHHVKSNDEAEDAVKLYRRILSVQPDKSVTIITVGFLTNIANLLKTKADNLSPLSGKELVKKKVKRMVSMAGAFPSGKEFNIYMDAAAAKYAFENVPCEVIYSGFEIGEKIKTGLPLTQNTSITNCPVQDVFRICIPLAAEDSAGRKSWDETAVLTGIGGTSPHYSSEPGQIQISDDGRNTWNKAGKGQFYLKEKAAPKDVERIINKLMIHQPARGRE